MSRECLRLFSLGNHSKQVGNQGNLASHITFGHSLYLPFPQHVHHARILVRFATLSRMRKSPSLASSSVGERLDEPVVLLDQIVEIFHLSQFHVFRQDASGFQVGHGLGIGRVFIDVDHARS
jgi:hypothetical protein